MNKKVILLILCFISNSFAADLKDVVATQTASAEAKAQQLRLPQTQNEKVLLEAFKNHELERANILIDIGTNPNIQNENGKTPLILATESNDLDLIKKLRLKGADASISDLQGFNGFSVAILTGDPEIIKEIFKFKNINEIINKQDKFGNTPLHHAANQNNQEIVELLLQRRANPFIKNSKGKTSKDLARSDEIKELLQKEEDKWNANGEELVKAAFEGDSKKVAEILKNGIVDVDYKTKNEDYPYFNSNALIMAARTVYKQKYKDYNEIIKLLINSGADVNETNHNGDTALMLASADGNKEIVELLIKAGADVLKLDNENRNALWDLLFNFNDVTKAKNYIEIIKLLIQKGGKQIINQVVPADQKPNLFEIIDLPQEYRIHVLQFLLDAGADLTLKDGDGRTFKELLKFLIQINPVYWVKDKHVDKILDFLVRYEKSKGK